MLAESHSLFVEERAPLLSTTALVAPETGIQLEDGLYTTPQQLSDGVTYTGTIAAHKLCGNGRLSCERGVYSGAFHHNTLTGNGRFSKEDAAAALSPHSTSETMAPSDTRCGSTAEANTALNTAASLASLSEDGLDSTTILLYEGEWQDGCPHGRGVLHWANGDVFEGLFDRGQPHGCGSSDGANTFTFADGRVYTGDFEHGLREGKGKLTHPNGDVYDGQFVRGTVTGFGTIRYAKGPRLYRGLLEHGRKVKGYLRFPGSQRGYEGEWQDDMPHGSGTMTFANGDFYKGDFATGELHGVGYLCYHRPAGKIYYGQFLHGQPCGRGFLYDPVAAHDNNGIDDEGSQAEPTEATVTAGYFQNGQAIADDDTSAKEAVAAATRGLHAPETTPPPYASLLQLRRASSATATLSSSFGEFGSSTAAAGPSAPPLSVVESTVDPATSHQSAKAAEADGVSSNVAPATNPANHSFGRPAPANANPPPQPSTEGEADADADEEVLESVSGEDADVDEAEADGAVLARTQSASGDGAGASVMPSLATSTAQDGSCRGWLEKCSIGRHNLSLISNWKRRYFILALCNDSICLGYYEDEMCRKPIGFIRLNTTDTRIVTYPTTKTHKKASRPGRDLCVIYHENRKEYKLLLRARDVADHDRWAAAFRSFFVIVDRPSDYPMHAFQS